MTAPYAKLEIALHTYVPTEDVPIEDEDTIQEVFEEVVRYTEQLVAKRLANYDVSADW